MSHIKIKSALISVFHKDGIDTIAKKLHELGVQIISTGGTQRFIENLDIPVTPVEDLTSYPSILDGRVKTLHPMVFGGILARREEDHLKQLTEFNIPEIDLVIVDLYPFEKTVASTDDEAAIIEKIDIGGISLIRAAAKNYNDVVIIPSADEYDGLLQLLNEKDGHTDLADRKRLARKSFAVSSNYDVAIHNYFNREIEETAFKASYDEGQVLRYGENPHQSAKFYGDLKSMFAQLHGKALSYNNLVDVDAGVSFMREFKDAEPTFIVIKHTNACGVATRSNIFDAWKAALACDNISAFGGILVSNVTIDLATAEDITSMFYEILIAPDFTEEALAVLKTKKTRRILKISDFDVQPKSYRSLLNGVIEQDTDMKMEGAAEFQQVTEKAPATEVLEDLEYANKCAKHVKSNTIVLVKGKQMIGMGCGQTSRIDACKQAIAKAKQFGFDITGSVMASDAFFPFPDCVEIADEAGVVAVVQPGGSKNDHMSISYCNENGLAMVTTGIRHFRH
ncbi:MAG: phosphoribosylaminoimidazolecarboxamide formyltransferase/IMP cyclohydrolase [Maribacter sp.]|jgi:phosphoribosylaminoimidazolecarboxamide formyltransferase/IMP cyclohydrolase